MGDLLLQRRGLQDRRLVARVLHRLTGGLGGCHLPRVQDVDPWFIGNDWVNCAIVRVKQPYEHSEFLVVGDGLAPRGMALDREPISKCPATTLLGMTLSYFERAVEERSSLVIEGATAHLDGLMLYRSVLVPLSEDDEHITAVLIAANSRPVASAEHFSAGARLVWAHSYASAHRAVG